MTTPRQVNETEIYQGEDERIAYQLTTTPWGSSPTSVSVALYDVTLGGREDASANLNGSASVSDDTITCPVVENLTPNKRYRLEIKFSSGGNTWESFAIINSEF
jgi:hypothetical protein